MKMHQRSKSRAWNILRLALLWARKDGVFSLKKRLVMLDVSEYIKNHLHLRNSSKGGGALHYGDRELSFDATPIIHVRMHRPNSMRFRLPHIPCINPHNAAADFDDDPTDYYNYSEARNSFLIANGQDYDDQDQDEEEDDDKTREEQGIDLKAEEFITNFYEQLKLQRQFNTRTRTRD